MSQVSASIPKSPSRILCVLDHARLLVYWRKVKALGLSVGTMDIVLGFQDVDRDIDRFMQKFGRPDTIDGTPVLRGYEEAKQFVVDAYFQEKAWDPLVAYYLGFNFVGGDSFILPLSNALRENRQHARLKRLWNGVVTKRKADFWHSYKYRNSVPSFAKGTLPKQNSLALASMRRYHAILLELGDQESAQRIAAEISPLEREQRHRSSLRPDNRRMTEPLFWELIARAREHAETIAEQIDALAALVESFKPSEIRRFVGLLREKLALAYHWDIWALAYIAQDGCSDDAFEAFRSWLVLQGQTVYQTALQDVRKVLSHIPDGLGSQAEGLLAAVELAYENRAGEPMKKTRPKRVKIGGKEWREEEIEKRYPEVWKHFSELRGL